MKACETPGCYMHNTKIETTDADCMACKKPLKNVSNESLEELMEQIMNFKPKGS